MSTSIDSEVFESDDGWDMRRSRRYNRLKLTLRSNKMHMNRNNSNNDTDDDDEEAKKRAEEAARLKKEEEEAKKLEEEAAQRRREEEDAQKKKKQADEQSDEEPQITRIVHDSTKNANDTPKDNVLTTPISMTAQEEKFLRAIQVTRKSSSSDQEQEAKKAKEVDEETGLRQLTVDAIMDLYSSNMYKPKLTGIKDHKHEHYMLDLLYKNEHTILDDEREDGGTDSYYTEAIVMIELIKEERVTNEGGILIPSSVQEIRDARDKVKKFDANKPLKKFSELYPYWPMNHELPTLKLPDELPDFYDKDFNPGLPTKETVDVFIYAPTNIRLHEESYAANCRHHITPWDEHPWCAWCVVKAGLTRCTRNECYLCHRMTTKQVTDRNARYKCYSNKKNKGKLEDRTDAKLSMYVANQIYANGVSRNRMKDKNHAWEKKLVGFCRPAWGLPMLMSINEYFKMKRKDLEAEIIDEEESFMLEYTRLARKKTRNKFSKLWPDLATMFKDMTKRRQSASKRKGQKKGQKKTDDDDKGQGLDEEEETDDGGGDDEQDDTLKNPGGLSPWKEDVWRMTGPVTDNRHRYDYHAAIMTSIQLKGC